MPALGRIYMVRAFALTCFVTSWGSIYPRFLNTVHSALAAHAAYVYVTFNVYSV